LLTFRVGNADSELKKKKISPYTVKTNVLFLINKIVATDYKEYY